MECSSAYMRLHLFRGLIVDSSKISIYPILVMQNACFRAFPFKQMQEIRAKYC